MSRITDRMDLMKRGNLNNGTLKKDDDIKINEIKQISIESLIETENLRTEYNQKSLNELAESIKTNGLLNPITVTPYQNKYQIIAGYRRYRACKIAGIISIDCNILHNVNLWVLQITENMQRDNLTGIEKENAIYKLKETGLKNIEIAKLLKKSEEYISRTITAKETREKLPRGNFDNIGTRQIYELSQIKDDKKIKKAARELKNNPTVKKAKELKEELITGYNAFQVDDNVNIFGPKEAIDKYIDDINILLEKLRNNNDKNDVLNQIIKRTQIFKDL